MMLWVAMAVLAAAASLAILVPLYRTRGEARDGAAGEISVYRDQLGEVDRDLDRGLIGESEATAARTEIARRLIKADSLAGKPAGREASGRFRMRIAALAALVAIPVLALGLYLTLGAPYLPDAPLSARLTAPPENQDLATLLGRVESHLVENPNDGEGWEVIAPVYVSLGRFDDAVRAYSNAVRLLGATAEREARLGEALVRVNQGIVTADARAAFERANALDKDAVMPRFYLALALAQDGKKAEAAAALKGMIEGAPPDAPWVLFVRQTLDRLEAPPVAESGPSADDVEAAAGMTPEERAAMIEGMVGQLAARLEADPKDPEGWVRLIRSYMVLGRADDAKAALEKARAALAGDPALANIEAIARSVGIQ